MSTVKISELPNLPAISANTSNTLFLGVDIPTGVTGKFTATTLAQQLYANNALAVGNNLIVFSNTIAQFSGNDAAFLQVNLQNFDANGSGDYVITADTGSNSTKYLDLGYNNSNYDGGTTFSSLKALDGYLFVHGTSDASSDGNLIIGTASAGANVYVIAGGTANSNVVAAFHKTGFSIVGANNGLTFGDYTVQTTAAASLAYSQAAFLKANTPSHVANSASAYANGAFTQANAAFITANTPSHVANSASVYANGAFNQANASFNKANNALANTTGTFAGDLTVTGNVVIKYGMTINNATMPGNSAYIVVTGTAGNVIGTPTNPGYTFHSAVDTGNRLVAEAYSNTASDYSAFIGRRARGTAASPLATQSGDTIVRFGGNGYGSTKFSQFSDARIEIVASQNHTDTAKGTRIRFLTTANNTNSATEIAEFNANTVTFTGAVVPQKGFVFTPNVHGTLTALTVDFDRDSLIKFNVTADATITLSNYQYGKVIEMWITNSGIQNRTITHGCLANNSTNKSTTFTITSSSCAYLRYFSIDGDQANTFVSIVA